MVSNPLGDKGHVEQKGALDLQEPHRLVVHCWAPEEAPGIVPLSPGTQRPLRKAPGLSCRAQRARPVPGSGPAEPTEELMM